MLRSVQGYEGAVLSNPDRIRALFAELAVVALGFSPVVSIDPSWVLGPSRPGAEHRRAAVMFGSGALQ
jgi:hypothetical protein